MRKALALAGLGLLAACGPAYHDGYGGDGYYEPAPTYYSAPPAYYTPPPTYYRPAPVIVQPRPVIIVRPPPRPQPPPQRHCWWDHGRPPRYHCR